MDRLNFGAIGGDHASMRRVLLILLAILIVVPAVYVAIAFGLAFATPRLALPGGSGITVYACDNGVHTDLVLPVASAGADWRTILRSPEAANAPGLTHVSFGWGSKDFYINTPTWADVRTTTALKAILWDETVLHAEFRPEPHAGEQCGVWIVGTQDYQRIVVFVLATLDWSQNEPFRVADGYGPRDGFYAARGQYTLYDTCNQWTGRALRRAGAPVAPWTPFSFLVLWNLPMISK